MTVPDDPEAEMWALAHELAKSGKYPNSPYIEIELRSRGYRDVDRIAKNRHAREEITKMCFDARREQSDAPRT